MLNRNNLNIAKHCSKDQSRFSLGGIQVTNEYTVATDGHCLIKVTTPDVDLDQFPIIDGFESAVKHEPFILDAKSALEISKAIPKNKNGLLPIIENAIIGEQTNINGSAYFAVTDLNSPKVFSPRKLEGMYPNFEQVIPKESEAKLQIAFNAELLAGVLQTLSTITDNKDKYVVLSFIDATSQVRIDCNNAATGQHATAVVMPVKLAK